MLSSIIGYVKPYKKQLFIGPVFKLIEAILELVVPLLMSRMLDGSIGPGDKTVVFRYLGWMGLFVVLGLICAAICQYNASVASQGFGTDLRNGLLKHIQSFSFAELDRFGTAGLSNRMIGDINQLQQAVAMLIRLVIRAPFLCIGGLWMAVLIDAPMAIILFVAIILFSFVLFGILSHTVPMHHKVQAKLDALATVLRENLANVRVIRAFARSKDEEQRFAQHNQAYQATALKTGQWTVLLSPVTTLILNMAVVALLFFGKGRMNTGHLSQGEMVAFITYIGYILTAVVVVANLVLLYARSWVAAKRVAEVLDTKPAVVQPEKPILPQVGSVRLENVSYHYPAGGDMAIQGVCLSVQAGQSVGIIGGTGAGKSTLLHLIPRFMDATEGVVQVSGQNVKDLDLMALRHMVGIALQQPGLFAGTIESNIRMGKPDATLKEVQWAAEIAQASEFIEKMEKGYAAEVLPNGSNLSGGQKQRISIARALIRRPQIMLFDDANSALDPLTDARLQSALKAALPGTTRIMVSQRVGALMACDRIYVMDDGTVVDSGTHEELINRCTVYQEIYATQMGREGLPVGR